MAINWDIWNTGLQNRLNEIGNGQYDWSFITPEVVQGFKKYQAQKKLRIPKIVDEIEKLKKELKDQTGEIWKERRSKENYDKDLMKRRQENLKKIQSSPEPVGPTTLAPVVQPEPPRLNDKVNDAENDFEKAVTEIKTLGGSGYSPESKGLGVLTDPYNEKYEGSDFGVDKFREGLKFDNEKYESSPDLRDRYDELTPEQKAAWIGSDEPTKEELGEIEKELLKERLGDRYDESMSIYDAYSKYNPYQRMIEAGKEASYWDPEAGKIFVDAGQRMYDENIKAWEQTRKTAESNRDYALKMYEATDGHPGWLATATRWQNEMVNLDKSNPRINGQYFTGLSEADAKNYGNAPTMDDNVSKIWERVLNGYVQDENGKLRFMEEEDLEGLEGFSDLNDLEKNFIRKKFRTTMEGFRKEATERDQKALTTAKTNEPLYKRWSDNQRDIYNGSVIDFNKNADGSYNYDQAANAFIYLAEKGVPLDQILEAVPANKELRKMIFHDGKLDLGMLTQSALASAFSSLAAKGLWEENSNAIMNMAKNMYNRDLELNNVYSKQMRDYLTAKRINWRGTQFDSDMQFDPKSINSASGAKTTGGNAADNGGASGDGAAKWKNIDFAGLDAPTTGTIQGSEKVKKLFMKNPDKFQKRIVDGLVQLYWNGDKYENTLTWDNVSKKWVSDQIAWSKDHPKPGTTTVNRGANNNNAGNTGYTGGGF